MILTWTNIMKKLKQEFTSVQLSNSNKIYLELKDGSKFIVKSQYETIDHQNSVNVLDIREISIKYNSDFLKKK